MTSDPDRMTRSPPHGKRPSQCNAGCVSPHEASAVNVGDLVLCRVGCKYWPAICSELPTDTGRSDKARFIFFGDHKELVTSVASARRSVRPFGDLSALTARDRPSCHLYDVAVEEAQQWHRDMHLHHLHGYTNADSAVAEQHAHEATHAVTEASDLCGEPTDGDWTINGEVVPLQLLLRANLRRLPKYGSTALVPASTPLSPAPTFRVINVGSARGGGGSSSSAFKDATFARRHAGLEQLEKRGYAAQPRSALMHGGAGGAGGEQGEHAEGAPGGSAPKSEQKWQRKRARSGEDEEADALLGRRVCVPASAFPECEGDDEVSSYDGIITGRRAADRKKGKKGSRREGRAVGSELEVYFASDHTTCVLSLQQAQQWLASFDDDDGVDETEAVQLQELQEEEDEQLGAGGEQMAVDGKEPEGVSDQELAKKLGVHRSTIWRRKQKALKVKRAAARTSVAAPSREATSTDATAGDSGVVLARAAPARQQLPEATPLIDRPRRSCRGADFDSVTLRLAGIPSPSDACSAEA